MKYFNGFSLEKEEALFEPYLIQSEFTVAGFSYGAIKAVEYAFTCKTRIDTLQLFSPAFFEEKEAKFKKLQTLSFTKNPTAYCEAFLRNVAAPASTSMQPYFKQGSVEELNELLYYTWDSGKLLALKERGLHIEVYLGEKDAIIDALHVKDFFRRYATVYYMKRVGHILR